MAAPSETTSRGMVNSSSPGNNARWKTKRSRAQVRLRQGADGGDGINLHAAGTVGKSGRPARSKIPVLLDRGKGPKSAVINLENALVSDPEPAAVASKVANPKDSLDQHVGLQGRTKTNPAEGG